MKTRTLAVVLCLITAAAFGQRNAKVKELQPVIGTFQCTGTGFASPMGPEHPTKATVRDKWILGGAWLELTYTEVKTAKNPHPYALQAFWGYDEEPKAFVAGSLDIMGGYSTQQSAGWEDDKLVFTGPTHSGGATSRVRDTFTRVGKNEIDHEGEIEVNGTWQKTDKEVCKRVM